VPLDENAIRQLRDSPTALDLYTWLAYRLPRINGRRPATLSWQQLAVHFGNDGNHIRKFRQTVRDAWDRQVSAVYPEARADFDSTLIRLHASPAPLSRPVLKGAGLTLVPPAVDSTTEAIAASSTDADGTPARFLFALRAQLGAVEARMWLADATLDQMDDDWLLTLPSRFKADWIRSKLSHMVDQAAATVGLDAAPVVRVRAP
jgi:hypothetical protein